MSPRFRTSILCATVGALTLTGCTMFRGHCSHGLVLEPRSAPLVEGERLELDVGAGELRVEVMPELAEARIRGKACSSSQQWLPEIGIEVEQGDGVLRIASLFPDVQDETFGLDLVVQIPEHVHVKVTDTSGSIRMSGVAGAEIVDGSGSIELLDVQGDVRIEDGSGGVSLAGVTGSVWLADGSGSIEIREVQGSVTIEEDGSGSIVIEDVWGDVLVSVDGSGSIEVRRVGGDFTVKEGGSGRVHFSQVEGVVTLP